MAQFTTTYTTLVSQLEVFVEDDSSEFVSAVQGCINRAEERVLRDLDLTIFNTIQSTTTSNGAASTTRSVTESPVHSIFLTSQARHVEHRSREYVQAHGGSGVPSYYSASETKIWWAPVPDSAYAIDIMHVIRPTPLSASNTTNWLTQNAADLLLWAALVESEKFLIAPERVQEFEATYASLLGPARAQWRADMQTSYEPVNPTPTPQQTR